MDRDVSGESILLMLNKDGVAEVYDNTYDITIHCVSEEEQEKSIAMLKNCMRWIPIEERSPKHEEYVLASFSNFSRPDIARYEEDEEGNGTYYQGDEEKSYLEFGLLVNAWMPLPECYGEKDGMGLAEEVEILNKEFQSLPEEEKERLIEEWEAQDE